MLDIEKVLQDCEMDRENKLFQGKLPVFLNLPAKYNS